MTKRVLLGLAMLVFGGVLAFGGGRHVYWAWASEHWPEAQGSVLASSVETVRSRRSVSFRPHVSYNYSVGAQRYTSESIAFAPVNTGDRVEAQDYVKRYPAGATVSVHYSPADPSLTCLECGRAGIADYVVTVGGVALALFALSGLVDALRSHRNARRRQQRMGGAAPQQTTRG